METRRTLIVGALSLVTGLFGGYFFRDTMNDRFSDEKEHLIYVLDMHDFAKDEMEKVNSRIIRTMDQLNEVVETRRFENDSINKLLINSIGTLNSCAGTLRFLEEVHISDSIFISKYGQ